jgi:hypothetical protein
MRPAVPSAFQGDAMKLPRRQFLHLAAGAAAPPAVARFAMAQTYPTRPVRIVVGFAPERVWLQPRYRSLAHTIGSRQISLRSALHKPLDNFLALMDGKHRRPAKTHPTGLSLDN